MSSLKACWKPHSILQYINNHVWRTIYNLAYSCVSGTLLGGIVL